MLRPLACSFSASDRKHSGDFPRALLSAAALLVTSARAAAHAPPQIARIVWQRETTVLLVTNRGLMFGDSAARDFHLLCNEALRINTTEIPQVAYRKDGALLIATSNGITLTRDEGCTFEALPSFSDLLVPALAQSHEAPDTLYAATFGGPGQSALRASHDGGATWQTLSALDDRDYTRSLLVAPGDAKVLYASGTVFADAPKPRETHYIARSSDAGKSWQRHTVALEEGELALLLLAVNPTNADELLVRAVSASPGFDPERLLWSRDGGQNVSTSLRLLSFDAATFAADGSAAWVATREGLFRARALRDTFQRVGSADYLSCAQFHADQLWTCGHYAGSDPDRDGVGRAAPEADTFTPFLDFREVARPVTCPPSSTTNTVCAAPWRDFHDEVVRPVEIDAGVMGPAQPDAALPASADADVAAPIEAGPSDEVDDAGTDTHLDAGPVRSSRSARCSLSPAEAPRGLIALGYAVFAATLCRRRSRRL